jgi:glycosyltransferase involved in cell wall biosynthesis
MKILVLSFYFPPDLSAGSFRSIALVRELRDALPKDATVHVVTTMPNRYSSFAMPASELQTTGNVTVTRIHLPSHKNGLLDQSRAFFFFAREVRRLLKGEDYDLVYATSSRLMTAALGAYLARQKKVPLYLDIRDLFVDTVKDVFPKWLYFVVRPVLSIMEKFTMNASAHVNLVSKGFAGYFARKFPNVALSFHPNGIDDEFIGMPIDLHHEQLPEDAVVTVVYAGNIGEGQGLHEIVPELAVRMRGRLSFKIIGDGGRKSKLIEALRERGVTNVELINPISREELLCEYQQADILFLHLNDYDAFQKVLPSKLFEYAASGKPIWAGVSGYAKQFVLDEIENAVVFSPCRANEALEALSTLALRSVVRTEFIEKYRRTNIMKLMASELIAIGNASRSKNLADSPGKKT